MPCNGLHEGTWLLLGDALYIMGKVAKIGSIFGNAALQPLPSALTHIANMPTETEE